MVVDEITDSPGQLVPRRALGGAPSYSSMALSSLGYDPEIVTHVGEDFPKEYTQFIKKNTGLELQKWIAPGFKTTSYRIDRSGPKRRLWLQAKCRDLTFEDFDAFLEKSSATSIVLNPVANEISLPLLEKVSKKFNLVFADSQGFVRRFDEKTAEALMRSGLDISLLKNLKVLKADLEELRAWTGIGLKESAIAEISVYVDILLLTSGPAVVEVYEGGKLKMKAAPFKVIVADTTGAGDIMLSSFAAKFTETGDIGKALAFSVAASTLAIRNYGIEKGLLSKEEVEKKSSLVEISSF